MTPEERDRLLQDYDGLATRVIRRVRARARANRQALWKQYFAARFPDFKIDELRWGVDDAASGSHIRVNQYSVENVRLDHWYNLSCRIPQSMPIPALAICAEILARYLIRQDNHPYRYRPVQGLLIAYWEQHYRAVAADGLITLLRLADELPCEEPRERCGFRAYMTTRSYLCTDGGALQDFRYRDWPGRAEWEQQIA